MKIILPFILAGIFLLVGTQTSQAQNDQTKEQALEMVKLFYTSYITFVDKGESSKLEALQKTYCTPKLLKRIPELADKSDQDPFLKAQDSNIEFLKSLVVEGDKTKEGHIIVTYGTDEKVVINLTVLIIDGKYKINNVW